MVHLDGIKLKSEVIEITGNEAKIQVFEDTKGIELGYPSAFSNSFWKPSLGLVC